MSSGLTDGPTVVVLDGAHREVETDGAGRITAIRDAEPGAAGDRRWTGGLVDIHLHGGGGSGFDTATPEAVDAALAVHRSHGVQRAVLSLVSAPPAVLARTLRVLGDIIRGRPDVAGIHLEGPFLSPARAGAHDPRVLQAPTPAAVEVLLKAGEGLLRQVTIAPELPGALDAVDRFVRAGIVVAVGHTAAGMDLAGAAFDRGASLLTHAFNAMPGLGHRDPGPIGAALDRDHVTLEVVADGRHAHPVLLRMLFAAAPDRIALVSDAMSATGAEDGTYRLGTLDVSVAGGRAVLTGTDTLAGSTLTLDRAVEVAVAAGVAIDDAIAAATLVPARALRIGPPAVRVGAPVSSLVAFDRAGRRVTPSAGPDAGGAPARYERPAGGGSPR